jgi:adenylate cyclase
MTLTIDSIRDCFDGAIPGLIATCSADGVPNVSYVSEVHYMDSEHLALTFQFFSKTRENVLANPFVTVMLLQPHTAAKFRIALRYLRTETEGPLFERMKAKLAGIASHSGMSGVFVLRGADVYRVLSLERVPGRTLPPPPSPINMLSALRLCTQGLAHAADLDQLIDETLSSLERHCDIRHAMLLMYDEPGQRLYTVASRGYEVSGVGSEIAMGDGVIGVCARERTPIRLTHTTSDYVYGRAIRESAAQAGFADRLETEIPFPGLAAPGSELAVPLTLGSRLLGVLFVESPEEMRFGYDDEDLLVALAGQLSMAIHILQSSPEVHEEKAAPPKRMPTTGPAIPIRYYPADSSVFIGENYLIKGVAGAIFWKLVRDYEREGRTEFSNRELRLDPSIRLPDIAANLEARLILLTRRLAEFRLRVAGAVKPVEIAGSVR